MEETTNVPQQQDVTPVEETTTTASSDGNQTAQTTTEVGTAEVRTEDTASKVPEINRYAEQARKLAKENQQLKAQMQQTTVPSQTNAVTDETSAVEAALRPILENMGYVRKDDVEQEFHNRELDKQTNDELTQLESKYNGSDGRPKFDRQDVVNWGLEKGILDPEAAYERKYRDELIDWHIKQAVTKSAGVQSESSDGSGSQEVGTTDTDLIKAAQNGDKSALRTFLKRFAPKG